MQRFIYHLEYEGHLSFLHRSTSLILTYIQFIKIMNSNNIKSSLASPTEYEFLIKTMTEGSFQTQAESLKRLQSLVAFDSRQFTNYSKRIIFALPELLIESKEDLNLLSTSLVLEMITINIRDVEFHIRNKLFRQLICNLSHPKPQLRKATHYCLLGYVKTFKSFNDLIEAYMNEGVCSLDWQLRQKSINSLQSILVMEMKSVNWHSQTFKALFCSLLMALSDEISYVQKAAEQCLISLCKQEEIKAFNRLLSSNHQALLSNFCKDRFQSNILDGEKQDNNHQNNINQHIHKSTSLGQQITQRQFKLSEELNQRKQVPLFLETSQQKIKNSDILKHKSQNESNSNNQTQFQKKKFENESNSNNQSQFHKKKLIQNQSSQLKQSQDINGLLPPLNSNSKQDKFEVLFGKKLIEDLKDEKDWKLRFEAVEELQAKLFLNKEVLQFETISKVILPLLLKLLGDINFKVALQSLKMIEEIVKLPLSNLDFIAPMLIEKLSDNKVALRQHISKFIKQACLTSSSSAWIHNLIQNLKKSISTATKQQILTILTKIYEEKMIEYPLQSIVQALCPLMDDLKTKIKIKTLDLLVLLALKTQKIDKVKSILASKMNQIYYEMFLEKIGKCIKDTRNEKKIDQASNFKSQSNDLESHSTNIIDRKRGNPTHLFLNSQPKLSLTSSVGRDPQTARSFYQAEDLSNSSVFDHKPVMQMSPTEAQLKSSNIHGIMLPDQKRKKISILRLSSTKPTEGSSQNQLFPPLLEPQKQLRNAAIELKSEDWQVNLEALNKLHRIAIHNTELLNSNAMKGLLPDIMKHVESLRSLLSKHAVGMLNEVALRTKRTLDSDSEFIFTKLIKKTLDTNSFISEEVKKALVSVCAHCSQSKIVSLLLHSHTSRAIPIKMAIVHILENITFLPKYFDKEIQRIGLLLVHFLNQASLDIRQKTKSLLTKIISSQKGSLVFHLIPSEHKSKFKLIQLAPIPSLQKLQRKLPQKIDEPIVEKQLPLENVMKRKKKQRIINFSSELDDLELKVQNCESGDWKIRLQSMSMVCELSCRFAEQIVQHRCSGKIMDVLSKQINDPNLKVALNALKIFKQFISNIPSLIEQNLSVILNQIFNCFSSPKIEIQELSHQIYACIAQKVEKWMLIQHLCNGSLYGLAKSRPIILSKLVALIPEVHRLKPSIFQKNIYMLANKLAEENKVEMQDTLQGLLQVLYQQLGEQCMLSLRPKAKQMMFG